MPLHTYNMLVHSSPQYTFFIILANIIRSAIFTELTFLIFHPQILQGIFYLATESKDKQQNPKTKCTNEKQLLVETDRAISYSVIMKRI